MPYGYPWMTLTVNANIYTIQLQVFYVARKQTVGFSFSLANSSSHKFNISGHLEPLEIFNGAKVIALDIFIEP